MCGCLIIDDDEIPVANITKIECEKCGFKAVFYDSLHNINLCMNCLVSETCVSKSKINRLYKKWEND